MTREEADRIVQGDILYHRTMRQGKKHKEPARARVTSIKTWKRAPEKIQIGMKYGLYDYFTVTERELADWFLTPEEALGNNDKTRARARRLRATAAPHGRCAHAGVCVENMQDLDIPPCRCRYCGTAFIVDRGRGVVSTHETEEIAEHEASCAKRPI